MSDNTLFPEQDNKPTDTTEQFVQQLKQKNAELEAKLSQFEETQNTLKELMAELRNSSKPQSTGSEGQVNIEALKEQLRQEFSEQARQAVNGIQTEQVQKTNESQCMQAAKAKYGDAYAAKLLELGSELGLTQEQIVNRARSEPKAFLRLFGLDATASGKQPAPTPGSNVPSTPVEKKRSLASLSTTADLREAWRQAGAKVAEQLGIDYSPDIHKIQKRSH